MTVLVTHRRTAFSVVVALMLENELEQFKDAVEARESSLDWIVRWIRGRLP